MTVSEWEKLAQGLPTRVIYAELPSRVEQGLMTYATQVGSGGGVSPEPSKDHLLSDSPAETRCSLCLFNLNMLANGSLEASISYKRDWMSKAIAMGFYVAYNSLGKDDLEYEHHEVAFGSQAISHAGFVLLRPEHKDARLVEFGVFCEGPASTSETTLMEIFHLSIKPIQQTDCYSVGNIRLIDRGSSANIQKRLIWSWEGSRDTWPAGRPWTKTTGPFSHFTISIDKAEVGRHNLGKAHCLVFPICYEDLEMRVDKAQFIVSGTLFGGGETSESAITISRTEFGLQL
ncbi:hypothetical protein MMC08_003096 [Hypocenomyce scalaris]|nr:hypothetical protein [Hypocenomyce scalaris]